MGMGSGRRYGRKGEVGLMGVGGRKGAIEGKILYLI